MIVLQLEENLERDKRTRQDLEKAKRKVEGELKVSIENIDEIMKQKHDLEQNLKKLVEVLFLFADNCSKNRIISLIFLETPFLIVDGTFSYERY